MLGLLSGFPGKALVFWMRIVDKLLLDLKAVLVVPRFGYLLIQLRNTIAKGLPVLKKMRQRVEKLLFLVLLRN
jgi:hypothetical protein